MSNEHPYKRLTKISMNTMTHKSTQTKEEQLEQLRKVLKVNGMNPTPEQLERVYEYSQVMEQILSGTFLCSDCGKKQHIYELRAD
jgi:hypothetical protein